MQLAGIVFSGGTRPRARDLEAIREAGVFAYLVEEETYQVASEIHDLLVKTHAADSAKVETIQRIGGIMDVLTVAEGVESEDVLAALSLIGVHFAQGNYVRRAVPLVQMHTLVGSSADTAHQQALAEKVSARAATA